jgi:hypothetical protein
MLAVDLVEDLLIAPVLPISPGAMGGVWISTG